MAKVVRNTILQYIQKKFNNENEVLSQRIFDANSTPFSKGSVVYICEREIRVKDNFALKVALNIAKKYNSYLKIFHPKINYENSGKQKFIQRQVFQAQESFLQNNLDFQICNQESLLKTLIELNPSVLVIDFNPILDREWIKEIPCRIIEVDGHNIIPARFVSDKQEYGASTLRRKIYFNISAFLNEFTNVFSASVEADKVLDDFIKNKLSHFAEYRNNPCVNVLSGLSKYLNLGFISAQRVAIEVIKSGVEDINKEAFLEELIVRKELADNFCLYNKNFKSFEIIPQWAKFLLISHKQDLRAFLYSLEEFENAKTHDILWNACQQQLKTEGIIHGYLRMYWGKKILEWSSTPEEAIKVAIYLNDKYAYDAPSSNGYVGILWALGGLHDRAFRDFFVTGKIRKMSFNSIKRKFNIYEYVERFR